ncbi:hypothetical protein A943_17005 [Bacillus sp. CPSM8]|nr:hypothetical protein A943_17005 [Bacillus sp. CPSM8]
MLNALQFLGKSTGFMLPKKQSPAKKLNQCFND